MAKVDVSGVVQVNFLEISQASRRELHGENRIAWLRRIYANNLPDEIRRFRSQARDAEREWSWEQAMKQSASPFNGFLACDQSTPGPNAIQAEEAIRQTNAPACLPGTQRQAFFLSDFQDLPPKAIAKQMKRTKGATAALIFRVTTRMRERRCTMRSNGDV